MLTNGRTQVKTPSFIFARANCVAPDHPSGRGNGKAEGDAQQIFNESVDYHAPMANIQPHG